MNYFIVDDIYWIIIKSASDLASTSPVAFISRNFDEFNKQAEQRMREMKKNNRISQTTVPIYGNWSPSDRPDGN